MSDSPSHPHVVPGDVALLPTERVLWGPGSITHLPTVLAELGATRVMVFTTASLVRNDALLQEVTAALGPTHIGTISDLAAHVPLAGVTDSAVQVRHSGADAILSFGGGSVIDAAKAVIARLADTDRRTLIHLSVPTTLSGAEFADHFGITEDHSGRTVKHTHARKETTPAAVVLDADLTAATPHPLWAGSGIKALDHAVEALLNNPPRPVLDAVQLTGIRRMSASLVPSTRPGPQAARFRQDAQVAAWECYVAPAAMTLGLSHRIGHVLGGTYGVPHSLTSAITLAPVMRAGAAAAPGVLAAIDRALDPDTPLELASHIDAGDPEGAAGRVEALAGELGLPTRLRDVGIERGDVDDVVTAVRTTYPAAVAWLGDDADERLAALLHGMW